MAAANKRLVKVGDTVRLKTGDRKFSKLFYGEDYKVEGIESNNGYWDGSSYITTLSDKNGFVIQLRMYENFFDIVSETGSAESEPEGEDMVGRKFKCKGHDTLYEIIDLQDNYYTIQWHKSDGELDSTRNTEESVKDAFAKGGWYFVDNTVRLEGVVHDVDIKATLDPEHTGGSVNYYKVHVANPTTLSEPYDAEANDIIESLGLTFAEGNLFKAIWRMAADRNGKKKKGNNSVYDAEKLVFFAERVLVQEKAKHESE